MATAVLHNGKALTGTILLAMFTVLAIVPQFQATGHDIQWDNDTVGGLVKRPRTFTLAEIKTLRARERLPQLRPASAALTFTVTRQLPEAGIVAPDRESELFADRHGNVRFPAVTAI